MRSRRGPEFTHGGSEGYTWVYIHTTERYYKTWNAEYFDTWRSWRVKWMCTDVRRRIVDGVLVFVEEWEWDWVEPQ